ncbi:hypothetical protein OC844_001727 [Tilletia horrida]|nr:hypothetical protein OC844_001727 [Tilletia horrida]
MLSLVPPSDRPMTGMISMAVSRLLHSAPREPARTYYQHRHQHSYSSTHSRSQNQSQGSQSSQSQMGSEHAINNRFSIASSTGQSETTLVEERSSSILLVGGQHSIGSSKQPDLENANANGSSNDNCVLAAARMRSLPALRMRGPLPQGPLPELPLPPASINQRSSPHVHRPSDAAAHADADADVDAMAIDLDDDVDEEAASGGAYAHLHRRRLSQTAAAASSSSDSDEADLHPRSATPVLGSSRRPARPSAAPSHSKTVVLPAAAAAVALLRSTPSPERGGGSGGGTRPFAHRGRLPSVSELGLMEQMRITQTQV